MNLESVSRLYANTAALSGTKVKQIVEQLSSEDMSELGVLYQVSQSQNVNEVIPSENYNGMIKNLKNVNCPYEYLADESGRIEYNDITFQCDTEHHALCLGDMSNEKNILTIPLSEGGVLKVNRDSIGDLSRAIGLFSPQDVKRIMQALATDAKIHSKECEMEKEEEDVFEDLCDGEENT